MYCTVYSTVLSLSYSYALEHVSLFVYTSTRTCTRTTYSYVYVRVHTRTVCTRTSMSIFTVSYSRSGAKHSNTFPSRAASAAFFFWAKELSTFPICSSNAAANPSFASTCNSNHKINLFVIESLLETNSCMRVQSRKFNFRNL